MLTIKLYQFSKNKNSTKQPDNSVTQVSYSALMKTASSLINPVITIKESPIGYNYCYIADFERYYFITDMTYALGEWELSLSVDSLASFKSDLGNVTTLVLRSASNKSGYLRDNLYPLSDNYTKNVQTWAPYDISSSGYYYVTAIGNRADSIRTVRMSESTFESFFQQLMNYGNDATLWQSAEQALMNQVYNPVNYVTSAYWCPIDFAISAGSQAFTVGNYQLTLSGAASYVSARYYTFSHTFSIGDHPQASVRGMYCNGSPFTEHKLNAGPFGIIAVPADLLNQSSNSVTVNICIDTRNGSAVMVASANGVKFARVNSSLGVDIPIAQTDKNLIGGAVNLASGSIRAITGDFLSGVAQAIGGATDLFTETVSTSGAFGSITNVYDNISLTSIWRTISGFDNDNNGCPYSQNVQLNTLSGFMQCEKGVFKSSKATETEINEINSYMVSGFYYE